MLLGNNQSRTLFVTQSFDGIELRRLHRRPDAKDQADAHADDDAGRGGPDRYAAWPFQSKTHQNYQAVHQYKRNYAAGSSKRHGLEQELPGDVTAFGADGF